MILKLERDNIKKEANKYIELQKLIRYDFDKFKSIQDNTWQKYKQFYKVLYRDVQWQDNYRQVLNEHMLGNNDKSIDFDIIITKLSTTQVEASFASKLIHTIDNSKAIYDSKVRAALGIGEVIGKNYDTRKKQAIILYDQINSFYTKEEFIDIRDRIVYEFDNSVDTLSEISNVKKKDFVLWALGKEGRLLMEYFYDLLCIS